MDLLRLIHMYFEKLNQISLAFGYMIPELFRNKKRNEDPTTDLQLQNIVEIICLPNKTFVKLKDGTIMVRGDCDNGSLGLGDLSPRTKFERVPISNVYQIVGNELQTFILQTDGILLGCEYNIFNIRY